jgi:hypothetical protein
MFAQIRRGNSSDRQKYCKSAGILSFGILLDLSSLDQASKVHKIMVDGEKQRRLKLTSQMKGNMLEHCEFCSCTFPFCKAT